MLWLLIILLLGVPIFLMWQNHDSGLLAVAVVVYIVMGGLEDWKKKPFTTYAPLVAYIALIAYGAVKIALTDEVFYKELAEVLVNIVKYGAILLLAIPFFYRYNKEKK